MGSTKNCRAAVGAREVHQRSAQHSPRTPPEQSAPAECSETHTPVGASSAAQGSPSEPKGKAAGPGRARCDARPAAARPGQQNCRGKKDGRRRFPAASGTEWVKRDGKLQGVCAPSLPAQRVQRAPSEWRAWERKRETKCATAAQACGCTQHAFMLVVGGGVAVRRRSAGHAAAGGWPPGGAGCSRPTDVGHTGCPHSLVYHLLHRFRERPAPGEHPQRSRLVRR